MPPRSLMGAGLARIARRDLPQRDAVFPWFRPSVAVPDNITSSQLCPYGQAERSAAGFSQGQPDNVPGGRRRGSTSGSATALTLAGNHPALYSDTDCPRALRGGWVLGRPVLGIHPRQTLRALFSPFAVINHYRPFLRPVLHCACPASPGWTMRVGVLGCPASAPTRYPQS